MRCGVLMAVGFAALGALAAEPEYLTGGPLAGLKLPANPTGQWGEVELYPGSVEHYRAYMLKYVPVRSFFDRQSMLKNWVVPEIPGAQGRQVERFAAPIYTLGQSSTGAPTGQTAPPVDVVRCRVKDPVFTLDLGELEPSLYAVRVIAAVETAKLRRFREPAYVAMEVNDGLRDEKNTYRLRIGYVDDFYSVAEIYFHAPTKRRYEARVWLDEGSKVDLLVHNLTLDDCLAGADRRAIKTRSTLHEPAAQAIARSLAERPPDPAVARLRPLSPEERLVRDEAIWRWLPPLNAQGQWLDMNVPTPGVTYQHPEDNGQFGAWEPDNNLAPALGGVLQYDPAAYSAFLVNKQLNLRYTIADLWARRPLPDPFPWKDDGAGLYFPDPARPEQGHEFSPIAKEVGMRLRSGYNAARGGAYLWRRTGNEEIARDAAVALIRFAYQYPAIDAANWTTAITVIPSAYGRDLRCRQREECARWMPHYQDYLGPIMAYDALFDYIQGNEELAASVRRFVPWVRNSRDLIELLDVYLVQYGAKRIMRYHDHTLEMAMATVTAVTGDAKVTDPWMEWLFSRTFVYPLDPAGIQDLMIVGSDRNGAQYIGSTYYAQGEGGAPIAAGLDRYIAAGGDPKYNLADPLVYPKPLAHCYWQLSTVVGGLDFLRIGDVCGPDKSPGATVGGIIGKARNGWRWSGGSEPRFAWVLAHLAGRQDETEAEWAAIQEAAARVKRAPWLDNRSRYLANWAGILETGLEHDDYRFRRAVYLRTGMGYGHQHADTFDLQVVAHGLPMTIDDGQRSGYCKPNSRFSRIHNVVEVNGRGNEEFGLRSHSWVQTIADAPGARYVRANAVPPNGARLFQRQVALLDVDEGQGSAPVPVAQQTANPRLPAGVTTANSYVFDVFRVSGGNVHTYCFHGPVDEDFQWNVRNERPVEHVRAKYGTASDADYLSTFERAPEKKFAGDCPDTLQATWRYQRQGRGSEQQMLRNAFDPASPPKFTRLHLFDAAGLRALRAAGVCEQTAIPYQYTALMAQRKSPQDLESAFVAVIEPYAGTPFIRASRPVPIAQNEADALRAVALEVQTADGHTDLCFADGRPDKVREVAGGRLSGEFAFVSRDAQGIRLATLAGGALLETEGLRIEAAQRERRAKIIKVDYPAKTFWIDAVWPALPADQERVFEVGTPERWNAYTAIAVAPEVGGSRIVLREGADFYRSPIRDIQGDQVNCALGFALGRQRGLDRNWVASNDDRTKFWRADMVGGNSFQLRGDAVSAADFEPASVLRLWEYGVGDEVRMSTFVNLRRAGAGEYVLTGDADATITLDGTTVKATAAQIAEQGGEVRLRLQ